MKTTSHHFFLTLGLTLCLLVTISTDLSAQTPVAGESVKYKYDSRGNRTLRYLFIGKRGVDEERFIEFKTYPNPSTEALYIESSDSTNIGIVFRVYTSDGRLMESFSFTPSVNRYRLDLTNYPAGLYFLKPEGDQVQNLGNSSFVVLK